MLQAEKRFGDLGFTTKTLDLYMYRTFYNICAVSKFWMFCFSIKVARTQTHNTAGEMTILQTLLAALLMGNFNDIQYTGNNDEQ